MLDVGSQSWKEDFAVAASVRSADLKFREKQQRHSEKLREQRENQIASDKVEQRDAEVSAVLATQTQIEEFEVKLDTYDTATVELLMDNRLALESVQRRLDHMLENATTLPDGRKVFKTRDGQRVFDEHGTEIMKEELEATQIADQRTRWEEFKGAKDEKTLLEEQRVQLLEYQAKLDEARNRLKDGDITADELKRIEVKLDADMPDELRNKLGKSKLEEDQKLEANRQEPVSMLSNAAAVPRAVDRLEPQM
jgi:hypothetical protein